MAVEETRGAGYTPMRVLMVTPRFAPELGVVESHVREVVRRLRGRGVCLAGRLVAVAAWEIDEMREPALVS